MGFYSEFKGEDDESLPPEEKAEHVSLLWNGCFSGSPSLLLKFAVLNDVVADLRKKAEEIDDEKSTYILNSFNLISQLEELAAKDDGVKFADFLKANPFFVLSFPLPELFELLCRWGPSPACVKTLLESPFADHVSVDRFRPHQASTPLVAAARHLCFPLVKTLLQFNADVLHHCATPTPLATAIESLSIKMYQNCKQDFTCWFYKLSSTKLREAVDTICLLASSSVSASAFDLNIVLKGIVFHHDWVQLALLLVISPSLLMCPPADAWSVDNTPVSRFLASLPCPDHAQQTRLNGARTLVKSVWEASEKLCKMFFVLRLIPSSEVEEPFPGIISDFFKQFVDAHSFEIRPPRKRARYEP